MLEALLCAHAHIAEILTFKSLNSNDLLYYTCRQPTCSHLVNSKFYGHVNGLMKVWILIMSFWLLLILEAEESVGMALS